MATPVNTVAAGGLPVVDCTTAAANIDPKYGKPVTEAAAGKGTPVTKVTNFGLPVTFVAVPP